MTTFAEKQDYFNSLDPETRAIEMAEELAAVEAQIDIDIENYEARRRGLIPGPRRSRGRRLMVYEAKIYEQEAYANWLKGQVSPALINGSPTVRADGTAPCRSCRRPTGARESSFYRAGLCTTCWKAASPDAPDTEGETP